MSTSNPSAQGVPDQPWNHGEDLRRRPSIRELVIEHMAKDDLKGHLEKNLGAKSLSDFDVDVIWDMGFGRYMELGRRSADGSSE